MDGTGTDGEGRGAARRGAMLVLTGPTGVGKSAFGLRLAREMGLGILSFDSMLLYRGLDIGTDKPSPADLAAVSHHLVDVAGPEEDFDVGRFLSLARRAVAGSPRPLLGVGGSPYYIQAFLGLGREAPPSDRRLERFLAGLDSATLARWLARLDPPRAAALHPNDRFRLVRALSIILLSGRRASSFRRDADAPGAGVVLAGLSLDRDLLHRRLAERVDRMFERGLVREAEALFRAGRLGRTAAAAVGYKELFEHFRGDCSLASAKERIVFHTRRLLRHQMTWLRKMPVRWIDVSPGREEEAWRELRRLAAGVYAPGRGD